MHVCVRVYVFYLNVSQVSDGMLEKLTCHLKLNVTEKVAVLDQVEKL